MTVRSWNFTFIALALSFVILSAESLWDEESESFLDKRAKQPGDPITIIFNDELVLRYRAEARANTTKDRGALSTGSPVIDFLPQVEYQEFAANNSEKETRSQKTMEGRVTVAVSEVLTNGNLRISGTHTIQINSASESVNINGIVSPKKLRKGNIVFSTDIINPSIVYSGVLLSSVERFNPEDIVSVTNITVVTNITTQTIGETNITLTNYSTNTKVTLELAEVQQQRLILQYLNKVLDDLFSY